MPYNLLKLIQGINEAGDGALLQDLREGALPNGARVVVQPRESWFEQLRKILSIFASVL